MKQLTIAVPAYNSEKFLHICLDSMAGLDDRLEIIVINDGSTDGTLRVANEYQQKYPDQITVIDKENGGHGSGINAGLEIAQGRFYKVVDSDDWIETENLKKILDALERSNADAVVTGYKSVNVRSGNVIEYPVLIPDEDDSEEAQTYGTEISMETFAMIFDEMATSYSFHGLCYRTDFLRGMDFSVSEKVFFEDQEYAILPFLSVETILLLPYFFYDYQIGSAGQSVDFRNQARRANDLKQVYTKMMDHYHFNKPQEDYQMRFFIKRLAISLVSYYAVVLVKSDDKTMGRKEAEGLRTYVMQLEPMIQQHAEKRYRIMRLASYVPFAGTLYYKLFDSKSYTKFKKTWNK
ncbi:MAG: glycosyltransferase family 2 protein [Lachnospiraceae bacterium]|nr:glycosyltransferase family 2 protein [Lachnospiraceae bacterium]